MSVLIVTAPLMGGYGIYMTLEAVASENYWMGVVGSLASLFAGMCVGKLIWG